ncbi:hypothetical protein [Novosphingobium sp. ST904]|uniref:hypothetical protein n=1 Tax=Novosphingobium sp. ST904 TaxID=1684385 RepID=UPI001044309E|nr:hypothetical protein [Novosphingobium sp. ST904]
MAALLLTTCGITACGIEPKRIETAQTDRATLDQCPRSVTSPGALPTRQTILLADGRQAIEVSEADARENMILSGALVFKRAWTDCRSVVIYVEERDAKLAK